MGKTTMYAVLETGSKQYRVAKGDTLAIHNDDEYIHQVFVDNPSFKFDSGEQDIGQTVDITFSASGTFQVLCAIHPKMRLDVVVK